MNLNKEEQEQFDFVFSICEKLQPQEVLEIGSGWGISASAIMQACEKTLLTTIDPRENLEEFNKRTEKYKNRITRIIGRSGENPSNPKYHSKNFKILEKLNKKYEFIYIDGSHEYKDVLYDLKNCLNLITPEGVIVLDDYFHKENFGGSYGVNQAVAEICKNKGIVFEVHPLAHGMVRIQK